MLYSQQIRIMLERFGNLAEITGESPESADIPVKAFIQPLRYKNKMYLEPTSGVLGLEDEGSYLYIGPPEPAPSKLGDNCKIRFDGRLYSVERAEIVTVGNEQLYCWAVMKPDYINGEAAV